MTRLQTRAAPKNVGAAKTVERNSMELKIKDFESALKSLEEIVVQLERGDLTLDRALELFEEGVKISRFCHTKLEEAERRVETLVKAADGTLTEVPFVPQENETEA
jgi:exodeoxyribonuclease VII small subunit